MCPTSESSLAKARNSGSVMAGLATPSLMICMAAWALSERLERVALQAAMCMHWGAWRPVAHVFSGGRLDIWVQLVVHGGVLSEEAGCTGTERRCEFEQQLSRGSVARVRSRQAA